ncbi:hypothetical protein A7Q09_01590 [Methylacidiphilum sp. Yel]|uniref:lipase family protein n=1 Tax=Methylacidiphilum sp. Yel TaxID=1847730 RepID=UPI00106D4B88|nr:lipase family protein [Methylacidiphilum sp. Yel]TFE67176.1 hypothetical protein A7Q09_01590 [Methylacidiphilum sp. Yel]
MAFKEGFDLEEALGLASLCAEIEETPLPNNRSDWQLIFDSLEFSPFNERWKLWKKTSTDTYAIVIRGTTLSFESILEDLLSFLIQSDAKLDYKHQSIAYKFASHPQAAVHAGFAIGALLLLLHPEKGIVNQLKRNVPSCSPIYITGHSQGAAVATLIRSYLHYQPTNPSHNYKSYVFAQPKPGNDFYAYDFDHLFSNKGLAFRIINSLDWVPQLPFTFELLSDINNPTPSDPLNPLEKNSLKSMPHIDFLLSQLGIKELGNNYDRLISALLTKIQIKALNLINTILKPLESLQPADIQLPVVQSFFFTLAATPIILIGFPCSGKDCENPFYQHSMPMYYKLMKNQLQT